MKSISPINNATIILFCGKKFKFKIAIATMIAAKIIDKDKIIVDKLFLFSFFSNKSNSSLDFFSTMLNVPLEACLKIERLDFGKSLIKIKVS